MLPLVCFVFILPLGLAAQLVNEQSQIPPVQRSQTVSLPIHRHEATDPGDPIFLAEISVGTPPQPITVQIDTTSCGLWLFAEKVHCAVALGCLGGRFDPLTSNSFKSDSTKAFSFAYGGSDANGAGSGDYVTDDVHIGSETVKSMQFGLAYQVTGVQGVWGVLGLAFDTPDPMTFENQSGPARLNLPSEMVKQGLIATAVSSLYLDSVSGDGKMLLGGVDESKFPEGMMELNVLRNYNDELDRWSIRVRAVGVAAASHTTWYGNRSFSDGAFLDTSTAAIILPTDVAMPLLSSVGAVYNLDAQVSVISCSADRAIAGLDTAIDVAVEGSDGDVAILRIPLASLIEPFSRANPQVLDGRRACRFAISPGPVWFGVLGTSFLRNYPLVLNFEEATVGLSKAHVKNAEGFARPVEAEL